MIRFNKKANWLMPYYVMVQDKLLNHEKISKIEIIKTRSTNASHTFGICNKAHGKYYIRIYSHYSKYLANGELEKAPYTVIETLEAFAHELSHTQFWEHTPDHQIFANKLLTVFMRKLKRDGYIDSESDRGGRFYATIET